MKTTVIALLTACCLLTRVTAGVVSVTELPGGMEIVGNAGSEAHVLRLTKNGNDPTWSDSHGNTFLQNLRPYEAVEVADGSRVLFPGGSAPAEVKAVSAEQVDVVARSTNGVTVTWTITPQRLGIRVDGSATNYTVRVRYPTHGEACRVHAGDKVRFATAGWTALEGSPQLVVDANRTRALSIEASPIDWKLSPVGYTGEPDYLQAELLLKAGQTLWLTTAANPAYDGPVEMGFFRHSPFHREAGRPNLVAKFSSLRLPATLTCSVPTNSLVVAGLFPLSPNDPVGNFENNPAWYWGLGDVTPALLPLTVTGTTIAAPTNTPPGIYRMRLWILPRNHPLPEMFGGPKGAFVGFFPGVTRGLYGPSQDFPTGDVFVKVGESPRVSVINPAWRRDFWRGEKINLLVQGGGDATPLTVREAKSGQVVATHSLKPPTEVSLTTDNLPPGEYRVEAGTNSSVYSFTIAPPRTPGMTIVNSQMSAPGNIAACDRLGLNTWTDIIPGGLPGWGDPLTAIRGMVAPGTALPAARSGYDELVSHNWLWLRAIHTRQLDFFSYHSIPEQDAENLRHHVVAAQVGQRYPSALGVVFDYDLAGVAKASSWGGGWETFGEAGEKRTKLLNARWEQYWKDALAHGAATNEAARIHNLFMAGVIDDIYQRSLKQLREHVPAQRHTTSITADHARIEDGEYLPVEYRSLDYRYLEVWNDQVYPCSANDLQESFWTQLLRMEKPANQPLWVTISLAHQPGTHLRRALYTLGRGATGIGYCIEGGAGLNGGVWGADVSRSSVLETDVKLSTDTAARYGAFFNEFTPHEEVAMLYSVSQGGYNFAISSPVNGAHYVLAQLNRPARLLTEDEIAAGKLAGFKALVIVRQTAPLPPATLAAIEKFAASGGKVIADNGTTLPVKGMQTLADLFWPTNFWPAGNNHYRVLMDRLAGKAPASMMEVVRFAPYYWHLENIPNTQPASLLTALGDAGRQPLEVVNGDALIATKTNGVATLVMVANENVWPFEDTLTADQLKTRFFRHFMTFNTTFYKDVCVPRPVTLRAREDVAGKLPHVYDVFAGRELRWNKDRTLTVDLATLSARALLLTPNKIEAPKVLADQRDSLVTIVVCSDVPLPVRVRAGNQEVYRAATAAGSCDTFALGQKSEIEVTELITGKTRRGTLESSPASAKLEELPAVQVIDVAKVKRVLASKGLAIYVDPKQAGQLEAAKKLAAKIPGAEVVFNPRVEDYLCDWVLTNTVEEVNERIRSQGLVALRRAPRYYFQWVGAMAPATVWNRPAVVFGNAGNNRLIADMNSVTLLPRPAWPEAIGAGRAFIGVVGAPFWNGQDVVYALCADAQGEVAALEKLASLPAASAPTFQRKLLDFDPPVYPAGLHELRLRTTTDKVGLTPCIPVASIQSTDDGLLVTLGSPGKNLVRLDNRGHEKWRTVTAGWYQPVELRANSRGESAVRDDGMTSFEISSFTWRHDATGKLLWKIIGDPLTQPAPDGSVWVQTPQSFLRIGADGAVLQTVALKDKLLALGNAAFVQRAGTQPGYVNVDAALVAVDLATGKDLWKVEQCEVMESCVSDDGSLLACVEKENLGRRDDLASSRLARLTVVETATGKVRMRATVGQDINSLQFSPDSTQVLARQAGYNNVLYLADATTGLLRQVKLPEAGVWATAFSRDSKVLWVACEKLYQVATDSLAASAVNLERIVALAAVRDGMAAGTSDGRVLWLSDAGKLRREVNLASGIAVPDIHAALGPLREAKLVESPGLRPNEFPSTVNFLYEYPRAWSNPLEIRGDAITPPVVAVHAPVAGKYRFTIPLYNAKTAGDALGGFQFVSDDGASVRSASVSGDKWQQTAVLELKPGVWNIRIITENWKCAPLIREMKIEKVN